MKYYAKAFILNDIEIYRIEMWYENNHATIYSGFECVYDGRKSSKIFNDIFLEAYNNFKDLGIKVVTL